MIYVSFSIYLINIKFPYEMSKCDQCIVRKFNSLKELTKEELLRISSCKTISFFKKGDVLFDEGEHLNGIFCIKQGTCKVSKMSENGRNQIINLVQKGNLLGERNLISEEVSNLKAIALSDMEVCFIPKEEIITDLEKNSNFSMSVLKKMANNLPFLAISFITFPGATPAASAMLNATTCIFAANSSDAPPTVINVFATSAAVPAPYPKVAPK